MRLSHSILAFHLAVHDRTCHYCAGRHDEAISWAESSLNQPNFASALRILVATWHWKDGLRKLRGDSTATHGRSRASRVHLDDVMPPFRRHEDRAKYIEGLRQAGLPE